MPRRGLRYVVVALAVAVAVPARGASFEALPEGSRIVVHVYKKGVFSGFAHDHAFEVTEWRASADLPDGEPASASVEVVLSAGSLHDRQPALSESDRRKVDAQAAGPEVLDAQHHPRIEFHSRQVVLEPSPSEKRDHLKGKVLGDLTLRGRTVPAEIAFEAERGSNAWRVHGQAHLKQSSFGIEPFSGFGGTVGVKDELELELALLLRPKVR